MVKTMVSCRFSLNPMTGYKGEDFPPVSSSDFPPYPTISHHIPPSTRHICNSPSSDKATGHCRQALMAEPQSKDPEDMEKVVENIQKCWENTQFGSKMLGKSGKRGRKHPKILGKYTFWMLGKYGKISQKWWMSYILEMFDHFGLLRKHPRKFSKII